MRRILISLVFLSANIQAINEHEFVVQLKKTHPFFNQQALSSQIRQIEKQATTANRDWIIAIDGRYAHENASEISSSAYDNLGITSIDFSASKNLTNSGADISFKHTITDQDNDINTTRNRFSLDYIYPLLRNRGGVNDRLDTDVAQIAIAQNLLQRQEQEENFILQNLQRFVNLAYAQEQQRINEHRLALANQELNLVKNKFAASVVDKVDVLLQEDAYQAAEQQLLLAQQALILLRREIAIVLALDFEKIIAEIALYRTHALAENPDKNQLLTNARVLNITELEKNSLKRQLHSFKNQNLAQLDLNLGLSSEGENTSYSNALNHQGTSWNVGLGLSYPLGHTKSSSNIRRTQARLNQLEQHKQEQLLELDVQASTLKKRLDLFIKILASNQKQIKIAKARTIEEKKRYANGNGEASFVINAQNNEQNAQLNYARVATDYQQSVLEYRATLDQLLP